ncbi:MAG TPA: 2-oxoacid:acceptor oxidoreductase subunit alpha, partial [Anaerolineales bacterium]|nr:2-oxoacid:acceptor oxidoreductase subunit alpha [Anaerolineales bacterium]
MNRETLAAPAAGPTAATPTITNEFSLVVATVNGSGSQTSNMAIMRALFRMGIPVSGKNLFPSNIQGLPTWFTIRASARSHLARKEQADILVAMNPETFLADVAGIPGGGVCFYADNFTQGLDRPDITYYPMPVQELLRQANPPKELREYIANMVYVGVVAQMMGIEMAAVRQALMTHFQGKTRAVESNMALVEKAAAWAQDNLVKRDPYRAVRAAGTEGKILVDGNTASALGAIYGGVTFAAWYPITPASSLAEALQDHLPELRRDPSTGRATYAVVQAEDEMAALGMAVGAGWMGARAMTSTSGPGISLMAEFAGLAFFAEVPVVIWDVQRLGPSTGLPTRTSQGDLLFVRFMGHGDTKHVILLPGSPTECFEFGWRAFDIAERLQGPVFVLSDLDIGMNLWMTDPFAYPESPMDRGKVLSAEDLNRLGAFQRYADVDGDGIPYRTLPGTEHPLAAYLARGSGHDEQANYTERPEAWERNMLRLWRKAETARHYMPEPVVDARDGAELGLIYYGSVDLPLQEARQLLDQQGIATSSLRLRAVPFRDEVGA